MPKTFEELTNQQQFDNIIERIEYLEKDIIEIKKIKREEYIELNKEAKRNILIKLNFILLKYNGIEDSINTSKLNNQTRKELTKLLINTFNLSDKGKTRK